MEIKEPLELGIVGNVPVSPHPIIGIPEQIYTYNLYF